MPVLYQSQHGKSPAEWTLQRRGIYIGVIEDVCMKVHVVKALRRQNHSHVITPIQQWNGLQEELLLGHLLDANNSALIILCALRLL